MGFRTAVASLFTNVFHDAFRKRAGATPASAVNELLGTLSTFSALVQVRRTATPVNLTAADSGVVQLIMGAQANTVNLPAPAEGLSFTIINGVGQNLTIACAGANQMIAFNNDVADGVSYVTAGNLIGAASAFVAVNADGAGTWKWFHIQLCKHTLTVAA